jgi:IS1 family transposase
MANMLKRERQMQVLHLLVEGSSIRSVERLTGVHRDTIMRLIVQFGNQCREFLDERMQGLTLRHIQCDEIWTFVAKKQARLTVDEKAHCFDMGDMYLWTAVDQDTKLVPTFALGKRSADNARRFMVDLAGRLEMPKPHDTDAHGFQPAQGYGHVCQLSTDGFNAYPEAVDLAFGPYVKYGVIVKEYRNATMTYTPSEMVGTKRTARRGMTKREEWTICTSHVERHNLTIRTFMKRFTRLSLGFSKKLDNLAAAVAMYMAFYNFCWRPRFPGTSGMLRVTPAMAAKIADKVWSFEDLFTIITQQGR